MKRVNIHLSSSSLRNTTRLFKEALELQDSKIIDNIILIGVWEKGMPTVEKFTDSICLVRVKLIKDCFKPSHLLWKLLVLISLFQFRIKIFQIIRTNRPYLVNCHHVGLLETAAVAKFFFHFKLVYDAHELETEVDGLTKVRKRYLKWIERRYIRYADKIIVVGNKIAEWYRDKYGVSNVYVVRNVPYLRQKAKREENLLRQEFLIPEGELIFIYNGFLTIGRGIEIILEAFSTSDTSNHIVFMGYGPKSKLVKEYALKYKNIHYKNAVAPEEVNEYTSCADVGLAIIENTSLSYYYSLSNKLFEYIHAGIPVVASDFPEMASILDKYQCGWKIHPDATTLIECLKGITPFTIEKKKSNLQQAQSELCWEKESLQFSQILCKTT